MVILFHSRYSYRREKADFITSASLSCFLTSVVTLLTNMHKGKINLSSTPAYILHLYRFENKQRLFPCATLSYLLYITDTDVLMTNDKHRSYNQFLYHSSFLSALHVSNESSRSSSAARHNILYYTVWYNRHNRAGQYLPA